MLDDIGEGADAIDSDLEDRNPKPGGSRISTRSQAVGQKHPTPPYEVPSFSSRRGRGSADHTEPGAPATQPAPSPWPEPDSMLTILLCGLLSQATC